MPHSFRNAIVLITGGVGFIGSNLGHRLVELGADVTVIDSLIPEYGGNLFSIADLADRVRVNISGVRDAHSMKHLVQDKDCLFNLAVRPADALPPPRFSAAEPAPAAPLRDAAAATRRSPSSDISG